MKTTLVTMMIMLMVMLIIILPANYGYDNGWTIAQDGR